MKPLLPRRRNAVPKPGSDTCSECLRQLIAVCCDGPNGEHWCAKCCRCPCDHRKTRKRNI